MRELSVLRLAVVALAAVILLYVASISLSGCKGGQITPEQTAVAQGQIDATKSSLAAQQASWETQLAAAQAQNDQRQQEAATKALATIAQLQAAADKASALLHAAQNPDGSISPGSSIPAITGAISPFLPPGTQPFAIIGGMIAGAIANQLTATKAAKAKTAEATDAAKSLVNGMDTLFLKSPDASKAFDEHAAAIHDQLTPMAAKILSTESIT